MASLALRERLPAIAGDVGFAAAGGLLEYHPALDATWREAAGFVDRIVKGAPIGSLPIRVVTERDLVVNQSTAEAAWAAREGDGRRDAGCPLGLPAGARVRMAVRAAMDTIEPPVWRFSPMES
jgi:hypothetical protein